MKKMTITSRTRRRKKRRTMEKVTAPTMDMTR